jgi:hypothetical protein
MNSKFILFRRVPKPPSNIGAMMSLHELYDKMASCEMEEWRKDRNHDPRETILEFVAEVTSVKSVVEHVAKDPTAKYVLFHGQTKELQVPTVVMCDGKALTTLSAEWD